MEIQITKQHTQSVHVPVPCFWKGAFRWIGLIDEKTVITFVTYDDKCEIANYQIPTAGSQVWLEAAQDGEHFTFATEDEFFEAYDKVMKQITITPILKTW